MTTVYVKYTRDQISEVAENLDIDQETLTKALCRLSDTPSDEPCKRKSHCQTAEVDREHLHMRARELAESISELNAVANNDDLSVETLKSLEKAVVCADHVVRYLDAEQEGIIPLPTNIPSEIKYWRQSWEKK